MSLLDAEDEFLLRSLIKDLNQAQFIMDQES